MLEHYVVFRPRPGKEGELAEALAALESGLAGGPAGPAELSWGENTNRSGLDRGFTHGCLTRFTGPEAFGRYWDHPAHKRFLGVLDGICEDRFALDWTSGTTA